MEFYNQYSGIFDSILGGIVLLFAIWLLKRSFNATMSFSKTSKDFYTEMRRKDNLSLKMAEDKARYRDLYFRKSVILILQNILIFSVCFFLNIFLSISIVFSKEIDTIEFILLILSLLISIYYFFSGMFITYKAEAVISKWMNDLEKENG